ncbi:Malonyl-[acyl-carrier protein] O-methyltransferase [Saliniradius amylolyticus]|uniref:Malonyl-[acyl-carrier protein] O-methyltransferase n=1 Tax=Saliniradius amylolyticus TaxID=2183582 RepID=A0A2S2E2F3_9ALTE|nr:methyltransferase domain-containing protein [Saliniradius amylolyticus]AWL11813.1 Malonyl-[acyl-carrier protein] O-methyltransferase [Saliniradius amylolyticus]
MQSLIEPDIKHSIARQFSRAAADYDKAAEVQRRIADDAVSRLPASANRLLDIGCGPGRITVGLQGRANQVLGLDLAFGMLQAAQHNAQDVTWMQGDADALPLRSESVDVVFSSMALQWCDPLSLSLDEIYRVLQPQGRAVLTLMVDGSFYQLNDCWQKVDKHQHVNRFADPGKVIQAATEAGFTVQSHQQDYLTYHASVRQLLGSIKAIGANVVIQRQSGYLGRHTLKNIEGQYLEHYGCEHGLPLTYRILTLELSK